MDTQVEPPKICGPKLSVDILHYLHMCTARGKKIEKKNETNITQYFTLLVMIFTTLLPVYTPVKCNVMFS